MKKWKQGFQRLLTGMLTVSMLAGTVPGMIPFASARAADVTPELTLTPEGQQHRDGVYPEFI